MTKFEEAVRALAELQCARDQRRAERSSCDVMLAVDGYLATAREEVITVLRAIREPSEAMVKAVEREAYEWQAGPEDWSLSLAKDAFTAGIDELLAEGEKK